PAMSFAKLERPSATPSIAPSHAGPAPITARNAGKTAVAVSWLQSLSRLVRPTPSTVRLSQDCLAAASGMRKQFTSDSSQLKVQGANSKAKARGLAHSKLLLCGAVENDADFLEGDEAAIHHLIEAGKDLFNALGGFDDFENDGQVLGEAK